MSGTDLGHSIPVFIRQIGRRAADRITKGIAHKQITVAIEDLAAFSDGHFAFDIFFFGFVVVVIVIDDLHIKKAEKQIKNNRYAEYGNDLDSETDRSGRICHLTTPSLLICLNNKLFWKQ